MFWFSSNKEININKFLSNGPNHIDDLFEYLFNLEKNMALCLLERYKKYVALLNTNKINSYIPKKWQINFLKGYLHQQVGYYTEEIERKNELYTYSLNNYKTFLDYKKGEKDFQFFAQWQLGVIQELLNFSWAEVEITYLKAFEVYPQRGESIRNILYHYYNLRDWKIGYIYSSFCINHFYGSIPLGNKTWHIDTYFYTWRILYYHIQICLSLGKIEEAKKNYKLLLYHLANNKYDFTTEEVQKITKYEKYFRSGMIEV